MTSKERILAELARASGPVCDDCLSEKANVRPRQQVNSICNPMGQAKLIVRQQDTCVVCRKLKLSSRARSATNIAVPVISHAPPRSLAPSPSPPPQGPRNHAATLERAWRWEGSVQDTLVAFLATQGWRVTATANTASKEPGIDIVATKDGRWLAVEVKGYPSKTYEHGPKRGEPKPTSPPSQARQWYSHALLSMMQLRHKRPDAEIAACFPDYPTYRRLLARTRSSFELLGFGVYFVGQDGTVVLELPHRPVSRTAA